MLKIAFFSLCLTSILFTSCAQKSTAMVVNNDIVVTYENRYNQKEDLVLYGIEQEYNKETKKFTLLYMTYKKIDVAEARELLVTAVNGFLNKVNRDKKNYPLFHTFSYKDIDLGIAFKSGEGQFAPANYVASLCLANGNVKYSFYDQQASRMEELHSEPYEIANNIIRGKILAPENVTETR